MPYIFPMKMHWETLKQKWKIWNVYIKIFDLWLPFPRMNSKKFNIEFFHKKLIDISYKNSSFKEKSF